MGGRVEKLPYYTYADYEHWEDQWELIGGQRVEQPSPIYGHQLIETRLIVAFFNALRNFPRYTVLPQFDYLVREDTVLQPDMLVVADGRDGKYLNFPPTLVAEILSPSTASRDKNVKFDIYESQGILYYLILSPETKMVEIYHWENGKYVLKTTGKDILFTFDLGDCKVNIDFSEVW